MRICELRSAGREVLCEAYNLTLPAWDAYPLTLGGTRSRLFHLFGALLPNAINQLLSLTTRAG
jgi:hypothetical protein